MLVYLNQREQSLEKYLLKNNFRIKKTLNLDFIRQNNLFAVRRKDGGGLLVYFKDGRSVRIDSLFTDENKAGDYTAELAEYEVNHTHFSGIGNEVSSSVTIKICKANNLIFVDCDSKLLKDIFKGVNFIKEETVLSAENQINSNERFLWKIINKLYTP